MPNPTEKKHISLKETLIDRKNRKIYLYDCLEMRPILKINSKNNQKQMIIYYLKFPLFFLLIVNLLITMSLFYNG